MKTLQLAGHRLRALSRLSPNICVIFDYFHQPSLWLAGSSLRHEASGWRDRLRRSRYTMFSHRPLMPIDELRLLVCIFELDCDSPSFGRKGSLYCSCHRKRLGLSALFLPLVCRRISGSLPQCIQGRTTMRHSLLAKGRNTIAVNPFQVSHHDVSVCH